MTSAKNPAKRRLMRPEDAVGETLKSARPENKKRKKDILRHRKANKKGGRPPAIDEAHVRKLEAAFTNDFTIDEALDYADVKRRTYYDYLKKSEEFSHRMRRAQQYPLTLAKRAVIGQMKGDADHRPDGQLGLRFLERRQPDRYRTKLESDTPPLPPITVILPGTKAHPRFTQQKDK